MQPGTVLVVEDDESIRKLLGAVLGERGYEVCEAADGPSALPAAREARPDVVLLDVGLPGRDGFAVLDQLKADAEVGHVPVLMVTAWADPDLIAKGLDRGADDYVRKPFDIAELAGRVEAAVRAKARRDALAGDDGRLDALTTMDPLTSLPNRAHLAEGLERELAQAARTDRAVSLVMLGLDGFAAVTETHGAQVGDALVHAVGRRLKARLRRGDLLGRWGGEEFLIVAPDTDLEGASLLAEELRAALAGRPLDTPGAAVRATASLGVAQWAGEELDAFLARCGGALEDARASGRNTVRAAALAG